MKKSNINFYSLCRSGHHAIIFWVLNNICEMNESYKDYFYFNKTKGVYFYNNNTIFTLDFLRKNYDKNFNYPIDYNLLVKNYEDVKFNIGNDNYLIIRDFLNLLCSRYEKWGLELGYDLKNIRSLEKLIEYWKQHAYHVMSNPKNTIIYNKWIFDKNYRDEISNNLDVSNTIDNTNYVPKFAGGSSYIGEKKESEEINYLNRFYKTNLPDFFWDIIIKDEELLKINRDIFSIDINKIYNNLYNNIYSI